MFHLPLLGGLALVGLPVLLHLLMRQKPKHILFPAFRFLQQRAKTNQRKIRLRHLLLLLLRMLLIALICFALAWLKGKNQVGAVVLLFDSSPSMEYIVGGKSRLEESKARANEILDTVAADSRVVVLETGDATRPWGSVEEARDRIKRLVMRPGAKPVTTTLPAAYRMFSESQGGGGGAAVQRQLFVFSDRTLNSWDAARIPDLQGQLERLGEPAIATVYIDVGVDKPVDVAVTSLEVKPASIPANREVVVRASVTALGQGADTEVVFKLTGEPQAERRPVKLAAGQTEELEFLNRKLKPGLYQAEISLATADALGPGNSRFVTFEVRGTRKILTISDDADFARLWELAFQVQEEFECTVVTPDRIQTVDHLRPYLAVCLFSVRAPSPFWGPLKQYVEEGGNLLVVPGRDDLRLEEYRDAQSNEILPGRYDKVITADVKKPAQWEPLNRKHPLLAKFATWRDREDVGFLKYPRSARYFWQTTPSAPQNVVVSYDVPGKPPAILERVATKRGAGRVLMLTTSLDWRGPAAADAWNDYATTAVNDGFYVVLANELIAYMVGDLEESAYNFASGQTVALPLPPAARFPEYTLDAPGITGADTRIVRGDSDSELNIRQTNFAGNARVAGGEPPTWRAAFSLNTPAVELQLDRLPVEDLERLFGAGTVIAPGPTASLDESLRDRVRQRLDLFPWLMLAFLGLLVVESVMANRFYKPESNAPIAA